MNKAKLYTVLVMMLGLIIGGFTMLDDKAASVTGKVDGQPIAYIEGTESKISFKLAGRIEELLVDEGDYVEKGQVLGFLQNEELQAKVTQAQAAIGVADGQISQAQGAQLTAEAKKQQGMAAVTVTEHTANKQIEQASAAVQAAKAKLEALKNGARPEEVQQAKSKLTATEEIKRVAESNVERLTGLLNEGIVSQAEVDKAISSYQEANAQYEIAKQQYELVVKGPRVEEIKVATAQLQQAEAAYELAVASKEEVLVRQGDVKAAEASLMQATGVISTARSGKSQAEAALAEAETYLSYTQLIAPTDGLIKTKASVTGELVNAGFPVFTLETEEQRWSKFYFSETDITHLQVGQTVQLQVVATGKKLTGKIVAIAPAADFAIKKATQDMDDTDLRSFSVKVQYTNIPTEVKTGMTVQWLKTLGERHEK